MKSLKTIIFATLLLAALSCTKNQVEGSGQVNFEIDAAAGLVEVTRSNVSDYTKLPSAGDFTITILDASSVSVYSGKLSAWDPLTQLQAGNYTVTATYGSMDEEGFDKPCFKGTASFAVTGNNVTNVNISALLSNTVVKVAYTDNFKNYYSDYTFKVERDGATIATFTKDETKAAFVDGYKLTLTGEITPFQPSPDVQVSKLTFSKDYSNLNEATAYTFLFDASNVGGATITVSFNDTVEVIDLGNFEINEKQEKE